MIYIVVPMFSVLVVFLISRHMVKKRVGDAAPHIMNIGKTSPEVIEEMKQVAKKVLENDQEVWRASKYKITKTLENGAYVSARVEERGTKVLAWPEDRNITFKVCDDNFSEKVAIALMTFLYSTITTLGGWLFFILDNII